VAVSDDGKSVMKSDIMRHALDYARMFDIPVFSHCEDINLSADGEMHEGFRSTVYGLQGIPAEAEEIMVSRDAMLAKLTGGRLHICHVSTMGSLEIIRRAKAEGIRITCEATPHHLTLTDEAVGSYDADTKVNPPLRSEEHVAALREAVASGLIDCIATDHAPHHIESKDCEYGNAAFGISGPRDCGCPGNGQTSSHRSSAAQQGRCSVDLGAGSDSRDRKGDSHSQARCRHNYHRPG